jgi:hypothetical protein
MCIKYVDICMCEYVKIIEYMYIYIHIGYSSADFEENQSLQLNKWKNIAQMAGADRESTEYENNMRYLYMYVYMHMYIYICCVYVYAYATDRKAP